ncbi:MAG: DUF1049 domain-containing protein [Tahibacter sp.]
MRFVWIVLLLLFAGLGALFGALNGDAVALDFYLFQTAWPKGAAWLAALLFGWLAGGAIVWLAVVIPLRRRLKQVNRLAIRANEPDARNASTVSADA